MAEKKRLDVELGRVKEVTSMKELDEFLRRDPELHDWWKARMGWV